MPNPEQMPIQGGGRTEGVDVELPLDVPVSEPDILLSDETPAEMPRIPDPRLGVAEEQDRQRITAMETVQTIQIYMQLQEEIQGQSLPDPSRISAPLSEAVQGSIGTAVQQLMALGINARADETTLRRQIEQLVRQRTLAAEIQRWNEQKDAAFDRVAETTNRLQRLNTPAPALTDEEKARDLLQRVLQKIDLAPMPKVGGSSSSPSTGPEKKEHWFKKFF